MFYRCVVEPNSRPTRIISIKGKPKDFAELCRMMDEAMGMMYDGRR